MEKKRLTLFFIGMIVFALAAVATGQQQHLSTGGSASPADTTVKKDSSIQQLNDPKSQFKDLFKTAVIGDGMNAAKLNPMAIGFVQSYIEKNSRGYHDMKQWARPYFDMMDAVLTEHGLPKELKYLAVIESGLRYNAISWTGAVGPWAFMPAAAKEYGLKVSKHNDERLDYYKSTHAASALLTDLFARYGDWLLVIAAYNGGPGNVDKAIRKSGGSKDFWTLQYNLPNESMNHVKKFIATHYIFEGEGGITTVTKKEMNDLVLNGKELNLTKDEVKNSKVLKISGRYSSQVVVKYISMDIATFNRYNPGFDNLVATNGTYELRLPEDKIDLFLAKKNEILNESMQQLLNSTGSK